MKQISLSLQKRILSKGIEFIIFFDIHSLSQISINKIKYVYMQDSFFI